MLIDPYRFGAKDPYFADVVLLMHFQGDYTDVKGHTIFTTGSPGFSTSPDPVLTGTNSWFAGGTPTAGGGSARLYTEFSSDFDLQGDFTMEQFVYLPDPQSRPRCFMNVRDDADGPTGNGASEYFVGIPTGGVGTNGLRCGAIFNTTSVGAGGGYAVTEDAWHHVVYQRIGSKHMYGVDGVWIGTLTSAGYFTPGQKRIFMGQSTFTLNIDGFYGYIAESRLTNGVARYENDPTNYTVPSYPFPDA